MINSDSWPRYQKDLERSGYHPEATPPKDNATEQWCVEFGDWGPNSLQPVVSSDTIFVVDSSKILHAINRKTGDKKWKFRSQNTLGGCVTVANDRVYVGGTAELPDIGVVGRL